MSRSLLDYYEWIRLRLGVKTPREAWEQAQDMQQWSLSDSTSLWKFSGSTWIDPTSDPPPAGAMPPGQMEPSNYKIRNAILRAVDTVIRRCRVKDAIGWTDINIEAQTGTGPYQLNLSSLPGFADRSVVTVKRAYWFDGLTYQPLRSANLAQLDGMRDQYLNDGPGTPTRRAVEGQLFYIMPRPDSDGTLRMSIGAGLLAPLVTTEGFGGIPESYDDCVLYVALVELASDMPEDVAMSKRAADFEDEKERGIMELVGWFDNGGDDQFVPRAQWQTAVPRIPRRN